MEETVHAYYLLLANEILLNKKAEFDNTLSQFKDYLKVLKDQPVGTYDLSLDIRGTGRRAG